MVQYCMNPKDLSQQSQPLKEWIRSRQKIVTLLVTAFFLFLIFGFYRLANAEPQTPPPQESPEMLDKALSASEPDQTFLGGIDFETYQRNLDDLFLIGLATHPDPDYGINALIVDLNRKLSRDPEDVAALIQLGHVYRIMGQPQEANRFYHRALQLEPQDFYSNVFAAKMHFDAAELEKAAAGYDKALAIEKSDPDVWAARARTALLLGNEDTAIESYEQTVELDPESEEALFMLGILYEKHGRIEEAFRVSSSLLEQHPKDTFARFHRGALFLGQNRPEKAIEFWEPLFFEGVREPQFLFQLALAYLQKKDAEKAENLLQNLRFFFPRETDIDYLLGEAYRQMGQWEQAERKFREVLAMEPSFVSASVSLASVLEAQGQMQESREILNNLTQNISPA